MSQQNDGPTRAEMEADPAWPVRPPEPVRNDIRAFFEENKEFYRVPWSHLDQTRRRFERAGPELQEAMMALSYVYAVGTVRVTIEVAEEWFRRITQDGQTVHETTINMGQINNKANYINDTLARRSPRPMAEAARLLGEGNIDAAAAYLKESSRVTGIGDVKSPFILSQLGYTSKMCLNANVQDLLQVNVTDSEWFSEMYEAVCAEIETLFPDISSQVDELYHLQWVIFDYNRIFDSGWSTGGEDLQLSIEHGEPRVARQQVGDKQPADHGEWFEMILAPEQEVLDTYDRLVRDARSG
jgi:hypothetical protein